MNLLLDSCALLWLAEDSPQLSPKARGAAADLDNQLFASSATSWELAIKASRGMLGLPRPIDEWFPECRQRLGALLLPIGEDEALWMQRLPALHRDPFDRMLVAQSIVHGLTILTPDPLIRAYPTRTLW